MVCLVVTPYYVAMVGILVAGFDRLCMCGLGHVVLSNLLAECRNDIK